MNIQIKRFCENDAEAVANIINQDLFNENGKVYYRNENVLFTTRCVKEHVLNIDKFTHIYVAYLGEEPIGCGIITDHSKKNASVLLVSFILPEYQGKGIGKQIIEALEKDNYYAGASQIEIPLTINANEFYEKIGYQENLLITA